MYFYVNKNAALKFAGRHPRRVDCYVNQLMARSKQFKTSDKFQRL